MSKYFMSGTPHAAFERMMMEVPKGHRIKAGDEITAKSGKKPVPPPSEKTENELDGKGGD